MANQKVKNRYRFSCELEGFVRLGRPGGKYNNCSFTYRLPQKLIPILEEGREELLEWAKSKVDNWRRLGIKPEPWDEEGVVKCTYGGTTKNKKTGEEYERANVPIVDTSGTLVPKEVLSRVGPGTKVKLIIQHKPYTKPQLGTSLKVLGMMIVELKAFDGFGDSGELEPDDLAELFGETEGFVAAAPAPRDTRKEDKESSDDGDDGDDSGAYNDF
jgi:hypothetical protein